MTKKIFCIFKVTSFIVLIMLNICNFRENIIGLIILLLYLLGLFILSPREYIKNLPYFFIIIPMLIGGFLIERGVYLFEINKYSYDNGTFLENLIYCLIFMEIITCSVKTNKKIKSLKFNSWYIEVILIIMLLILYGYFIKTGIPLLKRIHRTEYFDKIVPYYINFIKGRFSFICLVLGTYYANYRKKRYIFYFFMILLYHILCSIKGGDLLIITYMFMLPLVLRSYDIKNINLLKKINNNIRKFMIIFIILLTTILVINYKTVENYDEHTNAFQKIEKRIESAGQIWWVINDKNQTKNKIRFYEFLDNFGKDNNYKGMNQLMNEVVPKDILSVWRAPGARGRSLANGFPAIGYYYFSVSGTLILVCLVGIIINFLLKKILQIIRSNDLLAFLFIGPILEVIIRIVAQGDIGLVFEKRFMIIILAYIMYFLLKELGRVLKKYEN